MSYDKNASHLKYFIPNIAFGTTTSVPLREIDIGGSSGTHGEYLCVKSCRARRLGFVVSGEAAGGTTTAPTVIFTKRITPLSATGQVAVGTLTIPDTTAVGKVVYKDITPVSFAVGDSMAIAWTVGVGTPTGMGFAFWDVEDMDEMPLNNSDMIASA